MPWHSVGAAVDQLGFIFGLGRGLSKWHRGEWDSMRAQNCRLQRCWYGYSVLGYRVGLQDHGFKRFQQFGTDLDARHGPTNAT